MKFEQNDFAQEFDNLYVSIDELYHEIAKSQGLSDSAYEILQTVLRLGDGITQTNIYKYSALNKQTVNSAVKKLVSDGVIELKKGSGREKKIFLTKLGNKILEENVIPFEQAENEIYDEMTAEEKQEILRLLSKYLNLYREKTNKILKAQKND